MGPLFMGQFLFAPLITLGNMMLENSRARQRVLIQPHPKQPHPPDDCETQKPVPRIWRKPDIRILPVTSPEEPPRRGRMEKPSKAK